LIPVGTAMIIVAGVKYARVLMRAHTTNPSNRVANMATIILNFSIIFIFCNCSNIKLYSVMKKSAVI
jgi:hypothetical protein